MVPVCERGDDKTLGASQELHLVDEVHVGDGDEAVVKVLFIVEAWLLEPLKVRRRFDVHLHLERAGRWQKYDEKCYDEGRQMAYDRTQAFILER